MLNRYQSIFETSLDGIILITDEGIIEDINTSALQLFEYQKHELVGQNIMVLMPEAYRPHHAYQLKRYKETGKAKVIGIGRELEGLKKDGTIFPFKLAVSEFVDDERTYYAGAIHDLTKRKMHEEIIRGYSEELEQRVAVRTKELKQEVELKETAQKALLETTQLFETIARNFPNGSIYVLKNTLEIVFAEGSDLRQRGLNPEDVLGKNYLSNVANKNREGCKEVLSTVFEGQQHNLECVREKRVYQLKCVPLRTGPNGQILVVENNITKAKETEAEILATLQKERELNEMKTNFVSMASHEFRTPLSSILSSASLVERYTESSQQENRQKHLGKIRKNVQNLTMILNDFLSLEKIDRGSVVDNPQRTSIDQLFNSVCEDLEPMLKPNQRIICLNKLTKKEINVDEFLLKNVLLNLLSNALKYSDKDVVLKIYNSDGLTIAVQDRGVGISKEDQKNLFERFYRASNAGQVQGTGLGLTIVKNYIDIMGATLTYESQLDEGSTFKIRLNEK